VQGMHAIIQFCIEYPEITKDWHYISNYIGFLSVKNEEELFKLIEKAKEREIKYSIFQETDIDNQVTGLALEPGIKSKKLCSNLPLALK